MGIKIQPMPFHGPGIVVNIDNRWEIQVWAPGHDPAARRVGPGGLMEPLPDRETWAIAWSDETHLELQRESDHACWSCGGGLFNVTTLNESLNALTNYTGPKKDQVIAAIREWAESL